MTGIVTFVVTTAGKAVLAAFATAASHMMSLKMLEPLLKQWSAASLSAYFQSENAVSSPIIPEVKTGLSKCLIDILSNSPRAYSAFDNIEKSFPFLKPVYVSNIRKILDATVPRYDHSQACEQ